MFKLMIKSGEKSGHDHTYSYAVYGGGRAIVNNELDGTNRRVHVLVNYIIEGARSCWHPFGEIVGKDFKVPVLET